MDKKREDEFEFKYDCRDRISKLEALLTESSREKDEMRKTILELSTKVAELVTKIQYLENKK
jgi:phage shock protein A